MLRRLLVGVLALFAFGTVTAASAQDVEVTLGEEVALKIIPDKDTIDARKIPGRFRGIRVYALDGSSVDIATIDIIYNDGTKFTENRGRLIQLNPTDVRTRIIGPQTGEKFIDQIVLVYKTAPGETKRARVRVTGVTSAAGARTVRPGDGPAVAAPAQPRPGTPPASGQIPTAPTPPVANPAAPGTLTAGGDVLFGVQYVGFGQDRDVIKVGTEFGKFDKVRLRVLDNEIFINEMRVVYSNGEPDVLAVAANVPANTRTKWFTLKGDRFIKEIQLVYKSRPGFKGQARVEAYGEYAEGWYGPGPSTAGQPPKGEAFTHGANRGWLYLGGQQPLFFSVKKGLGYENDTVSVARNSGFRQIRLDVKDRAITLNKLTIVYGDGTNDVIPVGAKVDAGSSFGPVQLKPKAVREIQVSYRSRLLDAKAAGKSYAFVEFWAQ
ncbi:MAG: DUF2541 domain-containing protein [Hyphomicrobiaceae bacterium]